MRQSSQKYMNYHKSFDRAFNTRQDAEMLDFENARLPPLQTGELVTMPLYKNEKTENDGNTTFSKRGNVNNNENMRDMHLKPVVIRGARGLSFENSHKVRLPPINVNLQVRELLTNDERSRTSIKTTTKKLDVSRTDPHKKNHSKTSKALDKKSKNQILSQSGPGSQDIERNSSTTHSDKSLANNLSRTTSVPSSRGNHRGSYVRTDFIERSISMKEYSVLPPIGKQQILPEKEEKDGKVGKEGEAGLEAKKSSNPDETKFGLEEALESLAKDYDVIKGIKINDNGKNESEQSNKQQNMAIILPTQTGQMKENSAEIFTAIDDTLKNENDDFLDIPSERKQDCKRKRNYYKDVNIEDANEKRLIRKMRKRGRRLAICEEMDAMYRDLAIIVKHNLLIQHLEEICIF